MTNLSPRKYAALWHCVNIWWSPYVLFGDWLLMGPWRLIILPNQTSTLLLSPGFCRWTIERLAHFSQVTGTSWVISIYWEKRKRSEKFDLFNHSTLTWLLGVGIGQSLSHPLAFIVAGSGTDRVDMTPVVSRLRMNLEVCRHAMLRLKSQWE